MIKSTAKSRGASTKTPDTGSGNKGIVAYMKGKPAAKAAFKKFQSGKGPVKMSKKK
jgi:hypothetical protein